MPKETHLITVAPEQIGRTDHIVRDITGLPRSQVDRLFQNKCIRVNGKICIETFHRVLAGDEIKIEFDPKAGFPREKESVGRFVLSRSSSKTLGSLWLTKRRAC